MKELDSYSENHHFNFSKLLRKILIGLIIVVIFLILLAAGQITFLLQLFGWIENKVRMFTGLDMLLVRGITAILMATILILPIGGFILSFFPVPQKNKKWKQFTVLMVFAALFFASYFSSQNVFFDPGTGTPMKYYSISPSGEYKFYSSAGYDPLTGDSLLGVDRDVVLKYIKNNGSQSPEQEGAKTLGIAKEAESYSVNFFNDTGETLFLCISKKLETSQDDGSSGYYRIKTKGSVILTLLEGEHLFGVLDINGHNKPFKCQDSRPFVEPQTSMYGDMTVEANGMIYRLDPVYKIKIYPDNNLSVHMEDDKFIIFLANN